MIGMISPGPWSPATTVSAGASRAWDGTSGYVAYSSDTQMRKQAINLLD